MLCGGKLLPSGKCAVCGWDASKNDTHYRLNTHNENTVHLHSDDCEENLNRDNDGSPVRLNQNRGTTAGGSRKQSSKKSSSWARTNLNREKRRAQTAKTREVRRQEANSEETTKQFSAAASGKSKSPKKKRTHRFAHWAVIVIVLFFVIPEVLDDVWPGWLDEILSVFEAENPENGVMDTIFGILDGFGEDEEAGIDSRDSDQGSADAAPEREEWNETVDGYVSLELTQGNYYVGYDIPAGQYQLECLDGIAYVNWESLDEESGVYGYAILYSEEKQEDYADSWDGEKCPWYELSEVFELSENMILTVENVSSGLWLTGDGEGMDSLAWHEAQSAMESIYMSGDMTRIAGEDFEPGVYDITVTGYETYVWVDVEKEDGSSGGISFSLYEGIDEFLRYSFEDGDLISVSTYGEEAEVTLTPSW